MRELDAMRNGYTPPPFHDDDEGRDEMVVEEEEAGTSYAMDNGPNARWMWGSHEMTRRTKGKPKIWESLDFQPKVSTAYRSWLASRGGAVDQRTSINGDGGGSRSRAGSLTASPYHQNAELLHKAGAGGHTRRSSPYLDIWTSSALVGMYSEHKRVQSTCTSVSIIRMYMRAIGR